jgi:hypothetical protein
MYFIFLAALLCFLSEGQAHEVQKKKEPEQVFTIPTDLNYNRIVQLEQQYRDDMTEMKRLVDELRKKQLDQKFEQLAQHKAIQQSIPQQDQEPAPKPIKIPTVKMLWLFNQYYAENPENYPVSCTFIASHKSDLDKTFILNAKQKLSYKIKFKKPPSLECRQL